MGSSWTCGNSSRPTFRRRGRSRGNRDGDPSNPEKARCGEHVSSRNAAGEKDLQAVAGPFAGSGKRVRRAKRCPAMGLHFVEEKCGIEAHGIRWGASRRGPIVRGDEQKI